MGGGIAGPVFLGTWMQLGKKWLSVLSVQTPLQIILGWQHQIQGTIFLSSWSSLHLCQDGWCFCSERATSSSDCFMPSWWSAVIVSQHSTVEVCLCGLMVFFYACPACRLHMLYRFTLGELPKCGRETKTTGKEFWIPQSKSWKCHEKSAVAYGLLQKRILFPDAYN